MGMITKILVDTKIDWPVENSRIVVENNIGDSEPIHIHMWDKIKEGGWTFRIHFTYNEFKEFSETIINAGKL